MRLTALKFEDYEDEGATADRLNTVAMSRRDTMLSWRRQSEQSPQVVLGFWIRSAVSFDFGWHPRLRPRVLLAVVGTPHLIGNHDKSERLLDFSLGMSNTPTQTAPRGPYLLACVLVTRTVCETLMVHAVLPNKWLPWLVLAYR